jgi:nuclear pore complex protein Nup133
MRKPWTSRPSLIDAVLSLFYLSTEVLETSSVGSSIRETDREPGSQLPILAAILFESIKERLDELSKLLFMDFTSFCLR